MTPREMHPRLKLCTARRPIKIELAAIATSPAIEFSWQKRLMHAALLAAHREAGRIGCAVLQCRDAAARRRGVHRRCRP